jgi:hypothetical protein
MAPRPQTILAPAWVHSAAGGRSHRDGFSHGCHPRCRRAASGSHQGQASARVIVIVADPPTPGTYELQAPPLKLVTRPNS